MASHELYITSFGELPAEGQATFRPPLVEGSLQLANANVTADDLEPVVFTVTTPPDSPKLVTLRRTNGGQVQIFDASPTLPAEYDSFSEITDLSEAERNLWLFLVNATGPQPLDTPEYPRGSRYALRKPVGTLALVQCADPQYWAVTSPAPGVKKAKVLNIHAAQAFLELAGTVAVRKIAEQQQSTPPEAP